MEMQRLDKILASTGKWSRREAKLLVKQGRVLVDGRPAAGVEEKYDPTATPITVDGEDIGYRKFTWLMMHKPGGVLSATEDGRGRDRSGPPAPGAPPPGPLSGGTAGQGHRGPPPADG